MYYKKNKNKKQETFFSVIGGKFELGMTFWFKKYLLFLCRKDNSSLARLPVFSHISNNLILVKVWIAAVLKTHSAFTVSCLFLSDSFLNSTQYGLDQYFLYSLYLQSVASVFSHPIRMRNWLEFQTDHYQQTGIDKFMETITGKIKWLKYTKSSAAVFPAGEDERDHLYLLKANCI